MPNVGRVTASIQLSKRDCASYQLSLPSITCLATVLTWAVSTSCGVAVDGSPHKHCDVPFAVGLQLSAEAQTDGGVVWRRGADYFPRPEQRVLKRTR